MKQLDEILYDALRANSDLMQAVGERIVSTCFEVGPDEPDNTPLPCIIVTDDGLQNQQSTKDSLWESSEDQVQASVEIAANSPREVKSLLKQCRRAIETHVAHLADQGEEIPYLVSLTCDGIAWDWMKPCYYTHLNYQCIIQAPNEQY